jgi:hypothetical protein
MLCNGESPLAPEKKIQYGSLSGKILHPDNNLEIRAVHENGIDTVIRNPESQMFSFDRIVYGMCILQINASGYGVIERRLNVNTPKYTFPDIILSRFPSQIINVLPSNSQNIDSQYYSVDTSALTGDGFMVSFEYAKEIDQSSFEKGLSIWPDTAGMTIEWEFSQENSILFPYSKLATVDTLKVSLTKKVLTGDGDSLDFDFTLFYPIDTAFVRKTFLEK